MRRYDGPLSKSDRAFAFGLLGFLIGAGFQPGRWTTIYLAVLLVLAGLTVLNRAGNIVADAKGPAA
jgi:CDP-diacylglycerol--glycerol-3-phosphate 3-phosphatidyltransferase